ncbi:PspC family transcriptional regulator [Clostridia bacterium]|nr:PspC family transcriptional regulator [Clostridia bacterium]
MKRLYKSRRNKMICGVCGGLADYFGLDPSVMRIIVVALMLFAGTGLLLYIIAAIILPENPDE